MRSKRLLRAESEMRSRMERAGWRSVSETITLIFLVRIDYGLLTTTDEVTT